MGIINRDFVGALWLLGYYLIFSFLLPTIHNVYFDGTRELVRKTQHVIYSFSIFLLIKLFSTWYYAVLATVLLIVVAYPALLYLERSPLYQSIFVDRKQKGGELRMQLLLVNATFGLLLYIFWEVLGVEWLYIVPVAVMAWGFGDAAAALVGKAFGRKKVKSPLVDGPKTYAGTAAMCVTAFFAVFLTLHFYGGQTPLTSFLTALVVAPLCALVELFTPRGLDTLTVPLTAAFAILLVQLWR